MFTGCNGEVTRKAEVDLVVFDCQENSPVLDVSVPMNSVPAWNATSSTK